MQRALYAEKPMLAWWDRNTDNLTLTWALEDKDCRIMPAGPDREEQTIGKYLLFL